MSYDCYCDYDPPSWCTIRNVKSAKKRHKCDECSTWIVEGEAYEYVHGMWMGYIDTFKTCERCLAMRKWATAGARCFCWSYGNLHQDIRDFVDEYKHEVPGLFFEYGRQYISLKRERERRSAQ